MKDRIVITVVFGDDPSVVTVKVGGRSDPMVASLLGVDRDANGEPSRIFTRELLMRHCQSVSYEGWVPSGAISTVLQRVAGVVA